MRGGILVPTMWRDHAPYLDPIYEPVWAACAAADMPVHTHSGSAPQDEYQENVGVYLAEVVWWAVRPMWFLLFGGAFERHPNLKFCITESAAYWAPDLMWKWDTYLGGGHTTKKLVGQLAGKVIAAAERVLRPQRLHRRVDDEPRGDPPPLRDRHRHGDVGQRLPAPRGDVAAHGRQAARRRSTTSRSRTPC